MEMNHNERALGTANFANEVRILRNSPIPSKYQGVPLRPISVNHLNCVDYDRYFRADSNFHWVEISAREYFNRQNKEKWKGE